MPRADHAFLCVIVAEFAPHAVINAVWQPRDASWVASFLGDHTHHAFFGVLAAELSLLASTNAEGWMRGAP